VLVLIDSLDSDSAEIENARDKRIDVFFNTASSHLRDKFRAVVAKADDQLAATKQFVANVIQGRYRG
jgi:hypothetical protein